jgi:hypothetical protein
MGEYWVRPYDWQFSSVKMILNNPEYLGKLVGFRRSTVSFKVKDKVNMPEDEWIVVEGTHEPIIDQRTWDVVKEKITIRKRSTADGEHHLFSGLVKCADCGHSMLFSRRDNSLRCSHYNSRGKDYCTGHYIRFKELYDTVLYDVQRRAKAAAGMDKQLLNSLKREASGLLEQKFKQVEKDFKVYEQRVSELDAIFGKLYEDRALGRLPDERYETLIERYEREHTELRSKRESAERELTAQKNRICESE